MLALHKSFVAESPSGHGFEIKGKFKLMGSKSEILFKNASDGKEIVLELKGDWLDKSAEIKLGDQVVASISRKFFNAREFFGDKQTVSHCRPECVRSCGICEGGKSERRVLTMRCDVVFRRRGAERGSEPDRGHLRQSRRAGERGRLNGSS